MALRNSNASEFMKSSFDVNDDGARPFINLQDGIAQMQDDLRKMGVRSPAVITPREGNPFMKAETVGDFVKRLSRVFAAEKAWRNAA
jgi:hypothetical protein